MIWPPSPLANKREGEKASERVSEKPAVTGYGRSPDRVIASIFLWHTAVHHGDTEDTEEKIVKALSAGQRLGASFMGEYRGGRLAPSFRHAP